MRPNQLVWIAPIFLFACDGRAPESQTSAKPIITACYETQADLPAQHWLCGEARTLECGAAEPTIAIVADTHLAAGEICSDATYTADQPTHDQVGTYEVRVLRDSTTPGQPGTELCRSTLDVVDTVAPEFVTHFVSLWPPNHKMVTVGIGDCVTVQDDCDSNVEVAFTYAESDEPQNGQGDGNHEPDIQDLDCESVELRAERQGPEDGRVYRLGWSASDDSGNVVEGECEVVVTHDRSGRPAVRSGTAYRVELAANACGGSRGTPTVPNP